MVVLMSNMKNTLTMWNLKANTVEKKSLVKWKAAVEIVREREKEQRGI